MALSFSATMNQLLNSQEFSQAILLLLTIQHESGTMRYVRGWTSVESNGREFLPAVFDINLPDSGGDTPPTVNISFDAGDTQIVSILRGDSTPPLVYLEFALASSPNTIELGPMEFEVKKYSRSGTVLSVELGYEPVLNTPIPSERFTPALFPAML